MCWQASRPHPGTSQNNYRRCGSPASGQSGAGRESSSGRNRLQAQPGPRRVGWLLGSWLEKKRKEHVGSLWMNLIDDDDGLGDRFSLRVLGGDEFSMDHPPTVFVHVAQELV